MTRSPTGSCTPLYQESVDGNASTLCTKATILKIVYCGIYCKLYQVKLSFTRRQSHINEHMLLRAAVNTTLYLLLEIINNAQHRTINAHEGSNLLAALRVISDDVLQHHCVARRKLRNAIQ